MKQIRVITDIPDFIYGNPEMMSVLNIAQELNLPDWWIGAGFLRNAIWDNMDGNKYIKPKDIDLVYFEPNNVEPETDWGYDKLLKQKDSNNEWEVRNQARMHYVDGFEPFSSTRDGISHWVETATAVGVKMVDDKIELLFCYGSEDLFDKIARPTPYFSSDKLEIFSKRMKSKNWKSRWPAIEIVKK